MKKDIEDREDIQLLVYQFYDKVKIDEVIGHFFTRDLKVNWEKHLPIMVDFWQNMLFHSGTYLGNPLLVHRKVNQVQPILATDFKHWIALFTQTADELFEGVQTEIIKQRATSMATVMLMKLNQSVPK